MGTVYLVQGRLPGSSDEPGPPRRHSPLEIGQPAVTSAFRRPCEEGPALHVPALPTLCFRLSPLPDPAGTGPVPESRAPVPLTRLPGRIAWLWHQIAGTPEEVPLPRVSAQTCARRPRSRQVPCARARRRRRAALRELRGAFPGTPPLTWTQERRRSGWGSWFREGLDWFGCFKIDFFLVPWCFSGETGIELQCETWVDGKVKYWSFLCFALLSLPLVIVSMLKCQK